MQADHVQAETERQEEMHTYLERIDALQAKLTYLANETVAAAKEANASAGSGSPERLLAEKDERIALLMEEGEKLSKSEMKHLQTIKILRSKTVQADKGTTDLRKKLERVERSEAELKSKLRRSEVAERHANEKTKQIAVIEKQVDELRVDRENAAELVRNLTAQLKDANEKTARTETNSKASEADKSRIASLENELEDAQIEKRLAEDRAAGEIKKAKEESERQRGKLAVRELEFKNEMSSMESRLEVLRAHAEEATTSCGNTDGESNVKLMRQVEVLQQQYSLAQGNWETIEGSLNARVAALEKERDEASKRESDVRRKARDVAARSRKAEEERDEALDQIRNLEEAMRLQKDQLTNLKTKFEKAERLHSDMKADLDRQRKLFESEVAQRVEEEKLKWRREMLASPRTESPTTFSRKGSSVDVRKPGTSRLTSHDLAALHTEMRPISRRSSAMPHKIPSSREASPAISREESFSFDTQQQNNANIPAAPSIEVGLSEAEYFEDRNSASPQRTLADLVSSTSTAGPGGAGPSVQLVERMSALVRKLESEKASFRDELMRLSRQRDAARSEVVELMREVEAKRSGEDKVEELEKGMEELKGRYDASLEILGEKEEEVEELQSDVAELKRIYRELVEAKVGGEVGKK
jgi:chromosome segregation ATPase